MMNKRGSLLIAMVLTIAHFASAQYGSFGLTDARQLALGNTYASNSRGLYAAGKNPSLLAYQVTDRKLEILFPNLSMRQYNVNKVSNLIDDYFSRNKVDIITGIDGSLLQNAFANGGKLYLGLQIGFLGVSFSPNEKIGSFSFVMKDFINGYLQLPKALVNYVNSDNSSQQVVYFKDFNFQTTWMRTYELSYGRSLFIDRIEGIQALYAGVGIKYYQGFIYENISFSAGSAFDDENGVLVGSYTASDRKALSDDINTDNLFNGEQVITNVPFMDPVGQGLGFDIGLALQSDRGLNLGVSLTDLGFINWSGKTKHTVVTGVIRIDSTLTIDDIDSLASLITVEKETENQFQTQPTTAFHMGISFQLEKFVRNFPGKMGLTLEMHEGLIKDLVNPEYPRLAAGLDWKPGKWWPVLLTGITTSLNEGFTWSLGIGYELNFMELYVALPSMLPVIEGKGLSTVSLSMCWHVIRQKDKSK
jgi:hypothetical protein